MSQKTVIPFRSDETGKHAVNRSPVGEPARMPTTKRSENANSDSDGRPKQEKRPEGAHETAGQASTGRGDEGGQVTRRDSKNDSERDLGDGTAGSE